MPGTRKRKTNKSSSQQEDDVDHEEASPMEEEDNNNGSEPETKPKNKRKTVTPKKSTAKKSSQKKTPAKKKEDDDDEEQENEQNGEEEKEVKQQSKKQKVQDSQPAEDQQEDDKQEADEEVEVKTPKKKAPAKKKEPKEPKEKKPRTPAKRLTRAEKVADMKRQLRTVDWRELDFIGMEVAGMEDIYDEDFEFDELNKELNEGALADVKHPLYLFMVAQPIQIGNDVKNIPNIIVIDCKIPPSGKVASTSIQSGQEIIAPANKFHMTWAPYIPRKLGSFVELPIQLHTLCWEGRRSALANLSKEELHKISLLLPYELLPQVFEAKTLEQKLEAVKDVSFVYTASTGKKVDVVWDKECHRLAVDIDAIVEDEKLPDDEAPKLKEALKEAFNKARDRVKQQHEEQKAELEKLSPENMQALRSMKVYKFYPNHPDIDVRPFISPFVNRYYENATYVYPQVPDLPKKDDKPQTVSAFSLPTIDTTPVSGFTAPVSSGFTLPSSFGAPVSGFQLSGFSIPTTASEGTAAFVFNPAASTSNNNTSSAPTSGWKCECCEAHNKEQDSKCASCLAQRPKK